MLEQLFNFATDTATVKMIAETCCNCGVTFAMPADLHKACKNDPAKSFYCPNGHGMHFKKSDEQIKRERAERVADQLRNEMAQSTTQIIQLESQLNSAKAKLKRVEAGICPCCNRTFKNLAEHMKTHNPPKRGPGRPRKGK